MEITINSSNKNNWGRTMARICLMLLLAFFPQSTANSATIAVDYIGEHNIYFTLVDDSANEYKWHGGKGQTLSLDKVLFLIRKREYPDAKILASEATDERGAVYRPCRNLEEISQWIADNPGVEPIPWVSTHPKEASAEYQANVAEHKSNPLHGLTYAQVDAYIDSASSLAEIKMVMKKMARRIISLERQLHK